MITITIDDATLEKAAILAFANVLQGAPITATTAPADTEPTPAPEATAPETTKTQRRKPRTDSAPAPAPEPTPEPEPSEEKQDDVPAPQPEPEPDDVPSVVDIRTKAQEKGSNKEVKKAIKGLLDEFGSKNITDLPEDQRAAFMVRLEQL